MRRPGFQEQAGHLPARTTITVAVSCPSRLFKRVMNVSLGKYLEELVEEQVKTGIYQNHSEVVHDALRHIFLHDDSDDTESLAQCLRDARTSPRKSYVRGQFRKRAAKAAAVRRRKKNPGEYPGRRIV